MSSRYTRHPLEAHFQELEAQHRIDRLVGAGPVKYGPCTPEAAPMRPEAPAIFDLDPDRVPTLTPPPPKPVFPPLVYVAAPYRAPTGWGTDLHIVRARLVGAQIARLGAMPVIPHSNSGHFDGLTGDEEFWLLGTLAQLDRCDAIYLCDAADLLGFPLKGWDQSTGARAERDYAEAHGKPIFSALDTLRAWVERWGKERTHV